MPRNTLALMVTLVILIALPSQARATQSVIDTAAIAQLTKQLEEAKRQYDVLTDQFNTLKRQLEAVTGKNSFGGITAITDDMLYRLTQTQIIDMMRKGFAPGLLSDRRRYLEEVSGILPPEQVTPHDPNSQRARFYTHHAETTQAALLAVHGQQESLHHLSSATNDLKLLIVQQEKLKQSMDLNNALVANLTEVLMETLRSTNITAEQAAMINQVIVDSSTSNARFFAAPPAIE